MSGNIYLVQDSGELLEMLESPYDSEDRLQTLLASYPNLLAGNQINSDHPRRWVLVSREASLPSEEGGAGRWSVDHLFLDQEGIPTIVEVKRSTDTRIRREVIGQMLEYAANAVVYWPLEVIRAQFEANCDARGLDPDVELDSLLAGEMNTEQFWQIVQTNLQAGRVRLLFVADIIPPELRRLVEFLNGQMSPAEVLAVEVRQYTGPQQRVLVPRVIGQTQQAVIKKSGGRPSSRQWDEASFLGRLEENHGVAVANVARTMLDWSSGRGLEPLWGRGETYGTWYPELLHNGVKYRLFCLKTDGEVEFWFGSLKDTEYFAAPDTRLRLIHQINEIPHVTIADDRVDGYPTIPIESFLIDASLRQFLRIFDEVISNIRST